MSNSNLSEADNTNIFNMIDYNLRNQDELNEIKETENNPEKNEVWLNSIKADGGAYKGCPKNDYCQHFVDTRERPQNFIRDYEEEKRFLDYPKLNELIKRKNEVLQKRATPSMYLKSDLKNFDISTIGKFDVILIDPPLPEYHRRVEGQGVDMSNLSPWSFEELSNLRVEALADQCCFLFLWVGSSEGLDKGRMLLKKWNFRRCEDIVWIKTNNYNTNRKVVNDKDTLIHHTKEHCLVGIKGAVKRGIDGHFIHANIDTDVIVSEEPPFGSTEKPQELYRIIERFCLGRKRIELFGEDHNIRPGWLTLGKSLSNSNLDLETYNSYFEGDLCYPEVQGFLGGRYVGCTQEIESLRPRSPTRNSNNSIINPLSNNMGTMNGSNMNNLNSSQFSKPSSYNTMGNSNNFGNKNSYNSNNFSLNNTNYNNVMSNSGNKMNYFNYNTNNQTNNNYNQGSGNFYKQNNSNNMFDRMNNQSGNQNQNIGNNMNVMNNLMKNPNLGMNMMNNSNNPL